MRTTVDIPDPTYRKLKSKAAQEGCSVKELILRGVQTEIQTGARKEGTYPAPDSVLQGAGNSAPDQ